jgi:HD superfamily phosphohydrolase
MVRSPGKPLQEMTYVRDPLYGFIGLTEIEARLVGTSVFQRLSRIKQLAHTNVVFPSAMHTRLEHSLGTLYVAGRISERLGLSPDDAQTVRAAALLHDLGHGPYSHLFETAMDRSFTNPPSHERITHMMIETLPEIEKILGAFRVPVLSLMKGDDSIQSDIISSSLDADKLDYLRRDSFHVGVSYGSFDIQRVLLTLCAIPASERSYLGILEKGMDALESYRLGRYAMHVQVYEHHTRLAADDMFVRAFDAAVRDGLVDKEALSSKSPKKFLERYLELDDDSIQHLILSQGKKSVAKSLIQDIRDRRLLKRAFIVTIDEKGVPNATKRMELAALSSREVDKLETDIAQRAKVNRDHVIVHPQSIKIKLYERLDQKVDGTESPILVLLRDGTSRHIDELSRITASQEPIRRIYVFAGGRDVDRVKAAAESVFGVRSSF